MQEVFLTTVNQILMMFTFMVIGFFVRKKEIGGEEVPTVLSALTVNFFLPAMTYLTFADNFHLETMSENAPFILAGCIVLFFTFFISKLFAKVFAEDNLQKDIYMYSFLIPNIGYMGWPLVGGVFGDDMLYKMMMFSIPFLVVIYTYGIYILNPKHQLSFKKILNPSMVAMAIGMIFGLFHLKLPGFLSDVMAASKACMSPCAMILTGFILAGVSVGGLLTKVKYYLAALIRAILIPGIVLAVMLLLKIDKTITIIAVAMLCMPMGLNSVVFPEAYGGDGTVGAKTTFVSNVISIITIPLVFALLGTL